MAGWTVRAHRSLDVVRTDAIGWDHARGHADDPVGLDGRAALAARYLGHALGGTGVRGWLRRHRLGGHASCFSFWTPDFRTGDFQAGEFRADDATADTLRRAVAAIDPDPAPDLLRRLAAAQAGQAGSHRRHPVTAMFAAADRAAWGGGDAGDGLGSAQTLAAVVSGGLAGYLRDFLATAELITVRDPAAAVPDGPVATGDGGRCWLGGTVFDERPGAQCRVAIQLRLAPDVEDEAAAAVLAGLLDGLDGLLHRWLRAERGLVYGTVAVARPPALVIGASLLRERLAAVVDELRRAIDEIDTGRLPAEAIESAALRVRDDRHASLDDPFGALDDHRRRLGGQPGAEALAAAAPDAARRLRTGHRLSRSHRPAVGYVGPIDDAARLLEKLS